MPCETSGPPTRFSGMIGIQHDRPDFLVIRTSGTLTKEDCDAALPELENALRTRSGPHRILIRLEDFHGWEIEALWADIRFDAEHRTTFDRVAVVGESGLEEWGTKLSKPFLDADIRYFDWAELSAAESWLAH